MESHIRYADVIWGDLSQTKLHTLQRIQDRALSLIKVQESKNKSGVGSYQCWKGNLSSTDLCFTF